MGQFNLAVDPNANDKALVQNVITDYYNRSGSSELLKLKNREDSGKIYVTDNFSGEIFSEKNKKSIEEGGSLLNGYSQYAST